jgi:hypothetical protein
MIINGSNDYEEYVFYEEWVWFAKSFALESRRNAAVLGVIVVMLGSWSIHGWLVGRVGRGLG